MIQPFYYIKPLIYKYVIHNITAWEKQQIYTYTHLNNKIIYLNRLVFVIFVSDCEFNCFGWLFNKWKFLQRLLFGGNVKYFHNEEAFHIHKSHFYCEMLIILGWKAERKHAQIILVLNCTGKWSMRIFSLPWRVY